MVAPLVGAALVGGALSAVGQYMANEKAEEMTQDQMDFQERMSSTAHQREVNDLKAAGLNPVLSAYSGGASTPGGASFAPANVFAGMPAAASSIASASMVDEQTDLMKAQSGTVREQARLYIEQEGLAKTEAEKVRLESLFVQAQIRKTDLESKGVDAQNASKQAIAEAIRKSGPAYGNIRALTEMLLGWFNAAK